MVLEARYKAEEVGYSLVGEEQKEASNVVDYNINEEITKDASAVENANNQTTTGMATVVPGINAPKLLEKTSIIGGGSGGTKIEYISDYKSVDERQPIVDKVLGGEFTSVDCIFSSWSALQHYIFIPYFHNIIQVRFAAIYPGFHRFDIICNISGSTVTSVTTSDGDW